MGSLAGHLWTGAGYTALGLRWFYCLMLRYFLCRREAALSAKSHKRFRSSLTYPWPFFSSLPVDGFVISMMTGGGMIVEYTYAKLGYFPWHMNIAHITMYFFVFLFGVTVLLRHYRVMMIPDIEYAVFALGQFVQAFILNGHSQGTSTMETQVHTYAMYLYIAVGVLTIMEAYRRSDLLLSVTRLALLSFVGCWTVTLGFLLYPQFGEEPWDRESVPQMKMVMMVFLWTLAGMLGQLLSVAVTALLKVRCMSAPEVHSALADSGCSAASDRDHYRYMLAFSDEEDA